MTPREFVERFKLQGKFVIEPGCGDGRHTVELVKAGACVLASDGRQENVDATLKRGKDENAEPHCVQLIDSEYENAGDFNACWHCGLLYHLRCPITHLSLLIQGDSPFYLYLSTHYTKEPIAHLHREYPDKPREGLTYHSLRLPLNVILSVLVEHGMKYEIVDDRVERNGPRVELIAWRD